MSDYNYNNSNEEIIQDICFLALENIIDKLLIDYSNYDSLTMREVYSR